MRIILAVVAFIAGAALIAIAAVSVATAPTTVDRTARIDAGDGRYLVLDPSVVTLDALSIEPESTGFAAVSRAVDVAGWVGDDAATTVSIADGTPATTATGTAAAPSDPRSADLWREPLDAPAGRRLTVDAGRADAVLLASDGTAAAPGVILRWSEPIRYPWIPPFFGLGGAALVSGIALLVVRGRRSRGSRSRSRRSRSRRSRASGFAFVATFAAAAVLVPSASASDSGPSEAPTAEPTATATATWTPTPAPRPEATPAVTEAQLARILAATAAVVAQADASGDPALAAARLTGAALTARTAGYAARAAGATPLAPPPVLAADIDVVLPQATDSWPRRVTLVVHDEGDYDYAISAGRLPTTTALSLCQDAPRSDYRVENAVPLVTGTVIPPLAPAELGAVADPPGLSVALDELGPDYASVLADGTAAPAAASFDEDDDRLRAQLGFLYRSQTRDRLAGHASVTVADAPGAVTALGTADGGALAWLTLRSTETVVPVPGENPDAITVSGVSRALTGLERTTVGLATSYEFQQLFAVPPAGSPERIRALAYTQAVVSATEAAG